LVILPDNYLASQVPPIQSGQCSCAEMSVTASRTINNLLLLRF